MVELEKIDSKLDILDQIPKRDNDAKFQTQLRFGLLHPAGKYESKNVFFITQVINQ